MSAKEAPARAALTRLTTEEGQVYAALTGGDLVPDGWAGVRLEQEYVRWAWALARLTARATGRRHPPGSEEF